MQAVTYHKPITWSRRVSNLPLIFRGACGALFPDVVKNVATSSIELKKLTYIYLVQYADFNPQLALLSINSFQKDLGDRSQIIRASALRALSSVKSVEIIQIVMKSIRTALSDGSSYVRKTACACAVKVFEVDMDQFIPLREMVLKALNDRNTSVVGSAVVSFHSLCVARCPGVIDEQIALLKTCEPQQKVVLKWI